MIKCQKEGNELKIFNLEELSEVKTVTLSELGFTNIEFIPLETRTQSIIPRKIEMYYYRDRILAGDNSYIIAQFNTILKFDGTGSFISKIGVEGRGPNEFVTCHDLDTDERGLIYLIDGWKRKVFVYSEAGSFIRTISVPTNGLCDFRFVDGKFLFYNYNQLSNVGYSYNLLDTSGKTIKNYSNKYPFVKEMNDAYGFYHENLFYKFNGVLYKQEVYSDTIYSFENLVFKPHMLIEVGKRRITTEARSRYPAEYLQKNYIAPRNLFEFGDYLYYEFISSSSLTHREMYGFIASKTGDYKVLFNPEEGLIDDLSGGPNLLPLTIKDDLTVVAWIDALKLKNHVASEEFRNSRPLHPEKKKELEKLANSLKETDNPVLVMVKLKK
jgi:hypothetical protein